MRIDLNNTSEAPGLGQSAKSDPRRASPSSGGDGLLGGEGLLGEDTAKLSQDQGRVQELASQVSQLPEVRQDKVETLRRAIEAGSYEVTPGQAAEALLSAMQVRSAA